jgi:hypothetical protein
MNLVLTVEAATLGLRTGVQDYVTGCRAEDQAGRWRDQLHIRSEVL